MILDPNGQPVSTKPRPTIQQVAESQASIVMRRIHDLLTESLKDVNGGIMPTKKRMKRFLVRERRPDGDLFHWRGEPLLFVGHHSVQRGPDGKMLLVLPHKQLYLKVPGETLGPSN